MGTGVPLRYRHRKIVVDVKECLNADCNRRNLECRKFFILCQLFCGQAARPISTGKLNTLLCLHTRPINLVVFKGSLVKHVSILKGYLILRLASRLDAFSGYPFRT
jgi:hypothetical protein